MEPIGKEGGVVRAGSAGGTALASRETEGSSDRIGSMGRTPPSADMLEKSLGSTDGTPRTSGGSSTATGGASDETGDRSTRVGHGLEITDRAEGTEGESEVGALCKRSNKQ